MDFKETEVFNFKGAIRGMRNPMNSWDKSDSRFGIADMNYYYEDLDDVTYSHILAKYPEFDFCNDTNDTYDEYMEWLEGIANLNFYNHAVQYDLIGYNDLQLAQKLILAGNEHAKFMRQIFVSVDITAPLYWWKEMDTYKVGTVANSTSTMHKLAAQPIGSEMFEFDNQDIVVSTGTAPHGGEWHHTFEDYYLDILDMCENLRQKYLETNDKSYWRALVQILPEAWLQTRTWTANYAVLRHIYFQRKNHKLKEWHQFCEWIESLPYAKELITLEENNETN